MNNGNSVEVGLDMRIELDWEGRDVYNHWLSLLLGNGTTRGPHAPTTFSWNDEITLKLDFCYMWIVINHKATGTNFFS